jgi:DNA-binding MarR family transcriptional regulator
MMPVMEARGWLKRNSNARDQRQCMVSFGTQGKALLARAMPDIAAANSTPSGTLGKERYERYATRLAGPARSGNRAQSPARLNSGRARTRRHQQFDGGARMLAQTFTAGGTMGNQGTAHSRIPEPRDVTGNLRRLIAWARPRSRKTS